MLGQYLEKLLTLCCIFVWLISSDIALAFSTYQKIEPYGSGFKLTYNDRKIGITRTVSYQQGTQFIKIIEFAESGNFYYEFSKRNFAEDFKQGPFILMPSGKEYSHWVEVHAHPPGAESLPKNPLDSIYATKPVAIPMTTATLFKDSLDRSTRPEHMLNAEYNLFFPYTQHWSNQNGIESRVYHSSSDADIYGDYDPAPIFYDFSCVRRHLYANHAELLPQDKPAKIIYSTKVMIPALSSKLAAYCDDNLIDDSSSSGVDPNLSLIVTIYGTKHCKKLIIQQEICASPVSFQPLEVIIQY